MPFKDAAPTDPNILIGVMLPADAEAMRDMAYVFAEEFARLGYTREQLLSMFQNPFYGGAHGAYRNLGEAEIHRIVDECLNVWGQLHISIKDVPTVPPLRSVPAVQPPPVSSPAAAGEEGLGGSNLQDRRSLTIEQSAAIERLEQLERVQTNHGLNGTK